MSVPQNVYEIARYGRTEPEPPKPKPRKLLYRCYAPSIPPELAVDLGVTAATVAQQMFYWARKKQAKLSPQPALETVWFYHTVEEWQIDFPFWSGKTIERAIRKLEDAALIEVNRDRKIHGERVQFYRLRLDWFDEHCRAGLEHREAERALRRKELATDRRFHGKHGIDIWLPPEELKRHLRRKGYDIL